MRASEPSTADDTGLKEQAVTRRAFVSFGRLSDGQPGKCTESSSGQPGHFTERPSVRREPGLLAGRRKVTSLPQARAPSYRRDRPHRPGRPPFHASVTISTHGGPLWRGGHGEITGKGGTGGSTPHTQMFCSIAGRVRNPGLPDWQGKILP